ncbi:hypothetical protein HPB47_021731 [Ixodes persulcatus]|uniref:Uncharacterized protein n=1 Tax=Ixodes persulcatus TaxID=34615 RepID=A0AC60QCN3_IXOPE|nr:hypothetical protein HPB47_021731 [Ixodes persulcatus]
MGRVSSGCSTGEARRTLLVPGTEVFGIAGGEAGVGVVARLVVVGRYVLLGASASEGTGSLGVSSGSLLESSLVGSSGVAVAGSITVMAKTDSVPETNAVSNAVSDAVTKTNTSDTSSDKSGVSETSAHETGIHKTNSWADASAVADSSSTEAGSKETTAALDLVLLGLSGEGDAGNDGQDGKRQELLEIH